MTESFDERTLDEQVAYDEMKRSVEEYVQTRINAMGVVLEREKYELDQTIVEMTRAEVATIAYGAIGIDYEKFLP